MALLSEYGFSEGSGSTTADSSGNGYTIALSSGAWATGKNGSGLSGASVSNVVIGPSTITNRTTMCWFKINASTGNSQALILTNPSGNMCVLYTSYSGGVWSLGYYDQTLTIDVNGTMSGFSTGTWNHAAVTTGSGGIKVYWNGSQVASNASVVSRGLTAAYFGQDTGGNAILNGTLDEIRNFDTALSAASITTYMNTPISTSDMTPLMWVT